MNEVDMSQVAASADLAAGRAARSNGEPHLFVEDSRALPLVSIAVALRTGAASDPIGKEGLTRIMVRMLRRGCRGMTSHEFEETIDTLGAEISADVSSSVITLHADVITRSLDRLVDLLATMMAHPTFDQDELGKLLRETQGEIVEARDNDRSLGTRHFRRLVFQGHPYGRRVGGTIPTVLGLTQADVRAHHARHFTRSNIAIAFAGDVREARAAELAERLLSALPPGPSAPSDIAPPERHGSARRRSHRPARGYHHLRRHLHLAHDEGDSLRAGLVVRRLRSAPLRQGARRLQHVDVPRRQRCSGVHHARARAAASVARQRDQRA
jgi:predicted Zn-dependent peptidase